MPVNEQNKMSYFFEGGRDDTLKDSPELNSFEKRFAKLTRLKVRILEPTPPVSLLYTMLSNQCHIYIIEGSIISVMLTGQQIS
jgi:hypothetical protein